MKNKTKTKIGIIGCGNISTAYLKNLTMFHNTEVAACADLVPERARAKAAEFKVSKACAVDELLADPGIEIVVNLTIPKAHAAIALAALRAGKHVYGEKPLALDLAAGAIGPLKLDVIQLAGCCGAKEHPHPGCGRRSREARLV